MKGLTGSDDGRKHFIIATQSRKDKNDLREGFVLWDE